VLADYSGSARPHSPEWHVVGDAEYRFSVTGSLDAFVGDNVLYNSETSSTFGDPPQAQSADFTTLDLRAGVAATDGCWSAWVWGRNVTDEYYWTNQFVTQDVVTRYAAKPATYGASLAYSFR
jgi:iron complex outermembrane receptor protein